MSYPPTVLTINLNNGARVLAEDRNGALAAVCYRSHEGAESHAARLRDVEVRAHAVAFSRLFPSRYASRLVCIEIFPSDDVRAITGPDDMRYYVPLDGCVCGDVLCSGEGHIAKGGQ